jgi:hypothetical protein
MLQGRWSQGLCLASCNHSGNNAYCHAKRQFAPLRWKTRRSAVTSPGPALLHTAGAILHIAYCRDGITVGEGVVWRLLVGATGGRKGWDSLGWMGWSEVARSSFELPG